MLSMKKLLSILFLASALLYSGCYDDHDHLPRAKKYPNDVAVKWINLQQKLAKKTAGFSPGVTGRSFAYSGLTMYESIAPGMAGFQSVTRFMNGPALTAPVNCYNFHWPASANAAMAHIIRNLFASTSAANVATIDSLEAAFNAQFQLEVSNPVILEKSVAWGKLVAEQVFEWSKTDGGHEGYKPQLNTYVPPTGPGLWIPTPPAFAPAAGPYQGNNRTFVPGLTTLTQPSTLPLPAYSEVPGSDFYNMVNELYTMSQTLTSEDLKTVRTWADLPGNYNGTGHSTNIATQLIVREKLKLDEAAVIYAMHGIALNDAVVSCFKTKYTYNVIRPISYIRNVMGHTTWNAVIATPPHPEFSSAHAVVSRASSIVLERFFGKNYSFTDSTHAALYGARTYARLEDYATEGAWSRVLGGIHYSITATEGLKQGKKVGELVINLPFRKQTNHD